MVPSDAGVTVTPELKQILALLVFTLLALQQTEPVPEQSASVIHA